MADTAAAESVGMPQLDFSTFPNQIFWLVLTLLAIYFILSRIALPRIGGVLSMRAGTISNDIAAAEELKLKAREAEEAYNRALAEARAEAQRIIAATRAEIQADLDAAVAKADAQIAERSAEAEKVIAEIRAGALESVTEVARDTAGEIVAAMGFSPDAAHVQAAVAEKVKG